MKQKERHSPTGFDDDSHGFGHARSFNTLEYNGLISSTDSVSDCYITLALHLSIVPAYVKPMTSP